ncbi:MAG: NAD(P)/FAD-dependent oxidoreductase [Nitrospinota bacterium]|nr:NAD(P)/FAD-dependent oxidoreductase [Nitrospinota bacterium]
MAYDVLIIGAGLSGLAAGIRLALFNKKVCIVEKHLEIGGLNSFYQRKTRCFDVGLHAMTNYTSKGKRTSPLGKLLKQLRLRHEDLRLCQQKMSEIRFPGKSLRFTNDYEFFQQEIAEQFPGQVDGFQKLVGEIRGYDDLALEDDRNLSARHVLRHHLSEPLLIEMLLCPLMFYGSARENDMDFTQFVILFKSIFMEGFARPQEGMRYILNLMVEQYKNHGGELRMGNAVQSLEIAGGAVHSVTLADGESLAAETVISSMGYLETMRVCHPQVVEETTLETGKLSFVESQFVLDRQPADLGYDKSIVFYSATPHFNYRVPDALTDPSSGVVCCSNNFNYPQPLSEGLVRFTSLANFALWDRLPRRDYIAAKKQWLQEAYKMVFTILPDFRDNVVFSDTFTPKTILKYTGHLNGAVYGSPNKMKDGRTPVRNLFLCGTDQGFLGIVGATLSGITIANLYGLKKVDG